MEQPSARDQHAMVKVGNLYYVIGGVQTPENKLLDDIWILNTDNVAWASKNSDISGIVWEKVQSTNPIGGIRGHAAVGLSDRHHLILFGGINAHNQALN